MLYIGMSGAKQMMLSQKSTANNLANATTTGFKNDLSQFRSMPVFGLGHPTRAYTMTERPATDFTPGPLNTTGRELDVAIKGNGWIAVQAADGSEAYTRRGDLQITAGGFLINGAGQPVLGNGGPIAIPPAEKMEIAPNGSIIIKPIGQAANALALADQIRMVNPPLDQLIKGDDGLFRLADGNPAAPDPTVQIATQTLEGSNVSPVEAMVQMITVARQYETQVKVMKTAEETDSASTSLLRLTG